MSPEREALLQQAYCDWASNRAYWDGRNFRVRLEPATPTHHPKSKVIAPWNSLVKRLYKIRSDIGAFHHDARRQCGGRFSRVGLGT